MTTIGKLLLQYREHQGWTQQRFAEKLSAYAPVFKNLNSVTVSRWETGTTEPGLAKKKALLHYFADSECMHRIGKCHEIVRNAYDECLLDPLTSLFNRNYRYIIGNFPEFNIDQSHLHTLSHFGNRREHFEHIVDIERATNVEGYYNLTPQRLEKLCSHPSTFAIIYERKRQHLGHFIMFKIKQDVAEEIVHHTRKEYTVTTEDLCQPTEKGTYYIHAMYGKNPRIAALVNIQAYLHLFEHFKWTDNVLIFASREDGPKLTRHYGIEQIDEGYDDFFGFRWYGYMSPIKKILFSDIVVREVF